MFLHLRNSHVWVELLMLFILQFRMLVDDSLKNFMDFVIFGIRHQEYSSVTETVQFSECNLKLLEISELRT